MTDRQFVNRFQKASGEVVRASHQSFPFLPVLRQFGEASGSSSIRGFGSRNASLHLLTNAPKDARVDQNERNTIPKGVEEEEEMKWNLDWARVCGGRPPSLNKHCVYRLGSHSSFLALIRNSVVGLMLSWAI